MIACGGVRCEEKGLTEVDAGRVMVSAPGAEIGEMALRRGVTSPHPLVQGAFGVLLACVGSSRRGRFLEVTTPAGKKRFLFPRSASDEEVEQFVAAVERAYDRPIAREPATT